MGWLVVMDCEVGEGFLLFVVEYFLWVFFIILFLFWLVKLLCDRFCFGCVMFRSCCCVFFVLVLLVMMKVMMLVVLIVCLLLVSVNFLKRCWLLLVSVLCVVIFVLDRVMCCVFVFVLWLFRIKNWVLFLLVRFGLGLCFGSIWLCLMLRFVVLLWRLVVCGVWFLWYLGVVMWYWFVIFVIVLVCLRCGWLIFFGVRWLLICCGFYKLFDLLFFFIY